MKPFRPAPARVPFLSRARTLHRDRLSCAPGAASVPKIQMAAPHRACPGQEPRSGRLCPYAASVHSRPFPGFPTKPGCDSFLSPSSDLFSHGWEMDSHR